MSKSVLRRLSLQIPESEQPDLLASNFTLEVLTKAIEIVKSRNTDCQHEYVKCDINGEYCAKCGQQKASQS